MRKKVRFTRELEELKLVERTLGPFSPGDEAEVWEWDANVLEKNSLAVPLKSFSVQDMRKFILLQERSPAPISLPDEFYSLVRDSVRAMLNTGDKKAADEMKSALMSLLEMRIPKLIALSVSSRAKLDLPQEEMVLINSISEEVDEWSSKILNTFEKIGGEGGKGGSGGTVPRNFGDEADIQK